MKKLKFTIPLSKDTKGFSLIEVIMAMGILSVGLLAVAAMQISTVRNNRTGNTYTQATALARSQMEVIKNGDITSGTDILSGVLSTEIFDPGNPMDENEAPGGIYTRSWTLSPYLVDTDGDGIVDAPSAFARRVRVDVSFPFVGRGTRTVTLIGVVTGGGL